MLKAMYFYMVHIILYTDSRYWYCNLVHLIVLSLSQFSLFIYVSPSKCDRILFGIKIDQKEKRSKMGLKENTYENKLLFLLSPESTLQVLKLSLAEFSLPKFYQLFGISTVKSAAVSAFRTSYMSGDRSFTMSPPENEKMPLSSLEAIADALLEIMEVGWLF